ncbi:MAG: hypothetical protein ACF8GE_03795 [Phycisphaerales bacterium JB043]
MKRIDPRAWAAALSCLCVVVFWMARAEARPLEDILERVPSESEIVVTIDDMRGFRRSSQGSTWSELLTILYPRDGEARQAWRELSATFDRDELASFDALFGERVTLVCAGVWEEENPSRWMVISRVDGAFEKRLVRALRGVPRRIVEGVAIHSLEQGRFFLAPVRRESHREIVVCPKESIDLLMSFVRADDRLDVDMESIRQIQAQDALVWVRGDEEDPWWGAGAVSFRRNLASIDLMMRFEREQERMEGWNASEWMEGHEGDVFFAIERGGESLPFQPVLSSSDSFERLFEDARAMPSRSVFAARANESDDGLEVGLGLAFEPDDELAFNLDRTTAGLLVWLSTMLGKEHERHDFDGRYPDAMRIVRLDESIRLPMLGDVGPSLFWKRLGRRSERDWWGWGTTSEMLESLGLGADVSEAGDVERARDWLSVGRASPSSFFGVMHRSGLPVPDRVRPLTLLDGVSWWLWLEDAHTARGTIMLDLRLFDGKGEGDE